jgi:hypothetical protein
MAATTSGFGYGENEARSSSSSRSGSQSGTLPFYNKAVEDLLNRGKQTSLTPYQPYGGNLVAGFSGPQQQAFSNLQGQVGNWQPGLQQAQQGLGAAQGVFGGLLNNSPYTSGALGQIASGVQQSQYDPNQINQFMNPYMSNVVNEIGRLGNENFQQNTLANLNSSFGDAGQFGSSRNMMMASDAASKAQREISAAQGNALAGGFNSAMQNYGDWANRGIGASQNATNQLMGINQFTQGLGTSLSGLAGQQANIAGQRQQMGLTDVNALLGIGQQQQAQQQKVLDTAYGQFQQQQQYPWQQVNNYANLFKSFTAPQQSTSSTNSGSSNYSTNWNTNFKRGGLARCCERPKRMAKGGSFDWQISPEEQFLRDQMRGEILSKEALQYPDDENLMMELGAHNAKMLASPFAAKAFENMPPEEMPTIVAEAPTSEGVASDVGRMPLPSGRPSQTQRLNPIQQIIADQIPGIFDNRRSLLESIRTIPELQPIKERPMLENIGEAMLRSASQGQANYGQLLGRAGAAFYDREDAVQKENQNRALARLKLEESAIPDIGKIGATTGLTGKQAQYKQARGVDGSVWMANEFDPEDKYLIQEGSYAKQINDMAERSSRNAMKDVTAGTVEERVAKMQELTEQFRRQYAAQFAMNGAPGGTAEVINQPTTGAAASPVATPAPPPASGAAPATDTSSPASFAQPAPKSGMIMSPQEKGASAKIGEGMGKTFSALQDDAMKAQTQLNQLGRLEVLYEGVNTGKLTPLGTELAAWMKAFGFNVDDKLANKEAAQSLSQQMALQLRDPAGGAGMPGALSDTDRRFLEKMIPSLSNTPEGIKVMIDTYRKLARRSQDVAKMARQYKKENPRGTFDEGFYDYLQSWSDQNNLFQMQTPEAPTQGKQGGGSRGPQRIKISPEDLR